ncbi:hypothetical protein DL764_004390 [Monosporascus ibericus]|uniref:Major facilitator superfamily (MFS) profile domain-containing protein n=1 Tax=Monosporascus ibericus TaxID=155417 RepID=A0A4Q4TDA6_9PEZI|nr:hypothetical protein DL764_004390 [Monosporascus ibericus]
METPSPPQPPLYPSPWVFAINMFAMYIAVFCVALDNTIISTAIPQITNEFHSLDDVGCYLAAFFLTQCAFQLLFGKIYTIFSPKWTYLASLLLFEVGSLVCGIAPSSLALIIGRAVAGAGASGVFAGSLVIITHTSPLEKRPIWQGLISAMYGIASVAGPLVGGAFTDLVTWRWCFYINLPFGGVTAAIIIFFLHLASRPSPFKDKTPREKFLSLDPLGFSLFLVSMICLFIALEWWLGEKATIPVRIITQQTIWAACWFAFFLSGAFYLFIYFIPIYFQAVHGATALQSSINNIPMVLANVILAVISGLGVSKLGYISPFCYASVVFTSIGSGLLMTMTSETSTGRWIGYQILFGFGIGLGFQQPPNAPLTVLSFEDLPIGIATTLFARNLGASLFVTTGNSMLFNELRSRFEDLEIPGVDPEALLAAGATSFRSIVPSSSLAAAVDVGSPLTRSGVLQQPNPQANVLVGEFGRGSDRRSLV